MRIHSFLGAAAALTLSLGTLVARADNNPCGNFTFANLVNGDCTIEVSGGCSAQCQPINFEVGCTGGCTATATTSCTGDCTTQCVAQCINNPGQLHCFEGCHAECDGKVTNQCMMMSGSSDCVSQAKAQCDIHCKSTCNVDLDTSCNEHCTKCCNGGCTTQANFACDYKCFADLKGGCDIQCSDPKGAIFCKGQYVHASDIDACITYMATQGLKLEASAGVTCGIHGCDGFAKAAAGLCSASGVDPVGTGLGGAGIAALGLAIVSAPLRRRTRAKKNAK